MKQFDYKRAYAELAEPAWKGLQLDVQALVSRVCVTAANVGQDPDTLDTVWPVDEHGNNALKAAFSVIPSDQLARASRAVFSAGDWASGTDEGLKLQEAGAYWKFSSYCDQVLRERLELPPRGTKHGDGAHIEVHEGSLRLCVSTPDSWTWTDVGPATSAVREAIFDGLPKGPPGRASRAWWDNYLEECERFAKTLQNALRPTGGSRDFIDLERFMTEEG
jgi:hypothetical protein